MFIHMQTEGNLERVHHTKEKHVLFYEMVRISYIQFLSMIKPSQKIGLKKLFELQNVGYALRAATRTMA